jgi:hypothetical protein
MQIKLQATVSRIWLAASLAGYFSTILDSK